MYLTDPTTKSFDNTDFIHSLAIFFKSGIQALHEASHHFHSSRQIHASEVEPCDQIHMVVSASVWMMIRIPVH
jgi:hypothetical protein